MTRKELNIEGAYVDSPRVFSDQRGYFFESYKAEDFPDVKWVQENESLSVEKNVLRGMHLQKAPFAQSKLLKVVNGSVLDVILDLRKDSTTFMNVEYIKLNDKNKNILFVPKGVAHGFLVLEKNTIVQYKVDNSYDRESEVCIKWDSKDNGIVWPEGEKILSEKDAKGMSIKEYLDE